MIHTEMESNVLSGKLVNEWSGPVFLTVIPGTIWMTGKILLHEGLGEEYSPWKTKREQWAMSFVGKEAQGGEGRA